MMAALDGAIWSTSNGKGIGPPGFLGNVSDPINVAYRPLQDYHLDPPTIAPAVAARCEVIIGRLAAINQTDIESITPLLTSRLQYRHADSDFVTIVGHATTGTNPEDIIAFHRANPNDRRLAILEFTYATAEGRADTALASAVQALAEHTLATRGFVGLTTGSDDVTLMNRYTNEVPLAASPMQKLQELGLMSMVQP